MNQSLTQESDYDESYLSSKKQELQSLQNEKVKQIQNLENQIEHLSQKLNDLEAKRSCIIQKIDSIEIQSSVSAKREQIQMLTAKIEYLQQRIGRKETAQQNQDVENSIQQDSIYLKTLIEEKEKSIKQIMQKMNEIKVVAAINRNLDQLHQNLTDAKEKLEFVKSTQFSCSNDTAEELKKRIEQKIREIEERNKRKQELKNEISECYQEYSQQKEMNGILKQQLKLVNTIFRTYENRVFQQEVQIQNLKEELGKESEQDMNIY